MSKVGEDRPKRVKTGGRRKGTPNKTTAALKDMVLGALDRAGGEDYLLRQADQEPKAFMALLGRVLPMQVQGTGDKGEIVHRVIREIVRP